MNKAEILKLLSNVEKGSTCKKRQVAAILILNGEVKCVGVNHAIQSSKGVCYACATKFSGLKEVCPAIHAEIDCLLKAGEQANGGTLLVSYSPCPDCCRAIIKAGIRHVIVKDLRYKPVIEQFWYLYEVENYDELAEAMLKDAAIKYTRLSHITLNNAEVI